MSAACLAHLSFRKAKRVNEVANMRC